MRGQCQPSPVQQRQGGGQRSVRGRLSAWPLIVRRPDWEHSGRGLAGMNTPRRSAGVCVPAAGDEGTGAGLWGDRAQPGGPEGCALTSEPRGATLCGQGQGQEDRYWVLVAIPDTSPMTWRKWENSSQTDFGAKRKKKRK